MSRQAQNFVTILTKIHPSVRIQPPDETEYNQDILSLKKIENEIKDQLANYYDKYNKDLADDDGKELIEHRSKVQAKLDNTNLIHFVSLNVVAGNKKQQEPHYLYLEMTIDGSPEKAIEAFVGALETELIHVYKLIDAKLDNKADIIKRLIDDQYQIVRNPWPDLFHPQSLNGLPFSGTAGLDLKDMHDDAIIADFAQRELRDEELKFNPDIDNEGIIQKNTENSPSDLYRYVKKALIENDNNPNLSRAWQRASGRKTTPNFAEESDSVWKENWGRFKLVMAVLPNWVRMTVLSIYAMTLFVLLYVFNLGQSTMCRVQWETFRYAGSPLFTQSRLNNPDKLYKDINCEQSTEIILSLYPWFLIEGLLLAVGMYGFLRLTPPLFKRASGLLTILVGFNLFLWFAHILDLRRIDMFFEDNLEVDPLSPWVVVTCLFLAIYAGAWAIRTLLNKKLFIPVSHIFNSIQKSLYFILAILASCSFLYLWHNFFYLQAMTFSDYTYKFYEQKISNPHNIFNLYLFVPLILSVGLFLHIVAVFNHMPKRVKSTLNLKHFIIEKFYNMRLISCPLKASAHTGWTHVRVGAALIFFSLTFLYYVHGVLHAGQSSVPESWGSFKDGIKYIGMAIGFSLIAGYFTALTIPYLTDRKYSIKSLFALTFLFWFILVTSVNTLDDNALSLYALIFLSIPVALIIISLILLTLLGLFILSQQRNKQRYDNAYTDITEDLFENESKVFQNHMISVQRLIPENYRRYITLPLMLQAIAGVLARQRFRPGFLANVGTVHSARWIHLPDTDNYVFTGNYDGSFESYLEDFSKMSTQGTNLAWANCLGFPTIKGLLLGGVLDSDRFRRYARRSMQATPFWYSAVADKSAEQIRRNALIRDGLTQDSLSASQAQAWVDLFTSMPRPEWVIEKDKIQNMVFGGNGQLSEGAVFTVTKPEKYDQEFKRDFSSWINKIKDAVAFDGTRPKDHAVYFAISAEGLRALELDEVLDDRKSDEKEGEAQKGRVFSQPFVSGMSHPSRRNILGDIGINSPQKWDWSDAGTLAVILIYSNQEIYDKEIRPFENDLKNNSTHEADNSFAFLRPENKGLVELKFRQKFQSLTQYDKSKTGNIHKNSPSNTCPLDTHSSPAKSSTSKKMHHEPFGFADGISQPIMKGSKAALKNPKSIHIVEPGEIILGYRDNTGYFPPSPVIDEAVDVLDYLPNPPEDYVQKYPNFSSKDNPVKRDLGHNGSYLVIRKLEQNVDQFRTTSQIGAAILLLSEIKDLSGLMLSNDDSDKFWEADNKDPQNILKRLREINLGNDQDLQFAKDIIKKIQLSEKKAVFNEYSEWIQSLFVGRHKDGTALMSRPLKINKIKSQSVNIQIDKSAILTEDVISQSLSTTQTGAFHSRSPKSLQQENEFLFAEHDPQGFKCPFGSHIRRSNPRDGLHLENEDSLMVTQRHRILRRGRSYNEERCDKTDTDKKPAEGTFFMCLNADIDRQFELIQQSWLMSSKFHGLRSEIDPVAGQKTSMNEKFSSVFTIQTPHGDVEIPCMSNFITVRAGGYFFLPGKDMLKFLGSLHISNNV